MNYDVLKYLHCKLSIGILCFARANGRSMQIVINWACKWYLNEFQVFGRLNKTDLQPCGLVLVSNILTSGRPLWEFLFFTFPNKFLSFCFEKYSKTCFLSLGNLGISEQERNKTLLQFLPL